ncbi:UTP--glucose-1-phosphate uridylyltransferase [Candidatus Wolfebacteria bacterium CG1_02_39_135]|uniref:UTP--glucose-1-phosphate uridylyltransferase n=2 Tax=Candidatus Wolfeibacteriota TaxID=1752735 RepID=A0A2M7B751_9BACT|nr:UTP--glucose-1-phosphate uridylyltransferase GalU [Parcubacteria group bacterium]NCO89513.1 UTP--glucose-1-phosphate uridylyltransferase GalU [Candidatus Wolfebacteria bacterium]NCP58191.1 UTP--glucose-1-phosphate uridylyltransferase GalU [Candidatus Wolfebacteria bacterium]OIO65841.1 MAG: UTP--glucose-1-phosphate uridylyltransferase [Candidatus Wolfebacteria bacterium CG1_02_39_135]PIU98941.1 MAG: UTP--glucose-1-phosphate uridylyltransferase [Candidatus Wolfebacteria bacterium CG03_land_8_2
MKSPIIKKVIIPVAGLGTRFLPATKAQPKEMLPLIDKPVIQYLVEEAVNSGIKDVIFVTGRGKRAIEDHFDYSPELESSLLQKNKKDVFKEVRAISEMANFFYVRQKMPRGDGDAVVCASHLTNNEPVAVLFGDDIVESRVPCLLQMIKVFEKYGDCVVALTEVPRQEVKHYGVVKAVKVSDNIYEIKDIIEKPEPEKAPSNLIVVAKYILTPELFRELKKIKPSRTKELRVADGLKNILKKRPVYGLKFEGKRYDCGDKLGYLQATVDFALKHPEVKKGFKKYLKNLKL